MDQWNALLAGGTGLVGGHLSTLLEQAPDVGMAVSLVRKAGPPARGKLRTFKTDFDRLRLLPDLRPRAAFCCLGTTIARAGSQEAFRRVDHDYVLAFARAAREVGTEVFCIVSSVDADAGSKNFYLATKGEMEEGLRALGFPSLHLFRPSLLLGKRAEFRPAERLGMIAAPLLSPFMLGGLRRYRPVKAEIVAAAMLAATRKAEPGTHIHQFEAIRDLARAA